MNKEIRKLAWFVWRHYPPAKDWGRKLLRDWIAWHYERALTGVFKDRDERIVAAGIARPVMDAEEARHDAYATDPEGHTIYVDLAIAPNKRVFQGLMVLMKRRFGERERIAFQRYPQTKVRVYPFAKLMGRTLQKELAYGRS